MAAYTNLTGPMTTAQFGFLIKLIGEVYPDPAARKAELLIAAGMDKAGASARIDELKLTAKTAPAPVTVLAYVPPAGSYLVNGQIFKIKKPKWVGAPAYLTLDDAFVGSIQCPSAKSLAALAELDTAEKAHAAVIAYAKATGKCGVCHTKLTDPKSIAAGIGPVCAKKYGY
jgi:hypothetical protein